jgi:hypothetical protein
MAHWLPVTKWNIGNCSFSLNPGPFNIKEHTLIGITVSTAATSAYAIEILSSMDLFLNHQINAFGAIVLIITTQCLGYGMAGVLRKYLVYPAEMVWWSNLVQVVFYNAIHNTDEFKAKRMFRGWSYMKYFWIVCGAMFIYEVDIINTIFFRVYNLPCKFIEAHFAFTFFMTIGNNNSLFPSTWHHC